jgi:CRP/FNR family transcriptional regulator, anaerobic regulatory protein
MITIRKNIEKYIELSEEEWSDFSKLIKPVTFQKNQFIVKIGHICQKAWFIESGIIRYILKNGKKEKTGNIAVDGDFISEIYSFFTGQSAISDIQALANTEAWAIEKSDLEKLYSTSINWQKLGRLVSQHYLLEQIIRTHDLQVKTPEQRYVELLSKRPDLLQNVSLGVLASHLNITQEALSRIRNRIRF